jgi:hypothetical protein
MAVFQVFGFIVMFGFGCYFIALTVRASLSLLFSEGGRGSVSNADFVQAQLSRRGLTIWPSRQPPIILSRRP